MDVIKNHFGNTNCPECGVEMVVTEQIFTEEKTKYTLICAVALCGNQTEYEFEEKLPEIYIN